MMHMRISTSKTLVGEAVTVAVGVRVWVEVAVAVAVGEGVAEAGMSVGVSVAVSVGVRVGVSVEMAGGVKMEFQAKVSRRISPRAAGIPYLKSAGGSAETAFL